MIALSCVFSIICLIIQVNVIRDGRVFSKESADICRGDIIKLEGGDLVSVFTTSSENGHDRLESIVPTPQPN